MATSSEELTASLSIPTVTPDDLLQFHLRHFGSTFTGISLDSTANHEHQNEVDPEDVDEPDLGHYPDGTRRTLTDEQIAIFRHSEIQRLLLKQERDAEAAAELEMLGEPLESQAVATGEPVSGGDITTSSTSKVSEKSRKQFTSNSEKARNQSRLKQYQETEDWRVSTRRRVRELDEVSKKDDVVLDY